MENDEGPAGTKLLPCTFQFHDFSAQVGDVTIFCHAIIMEESLYLWVGDSANGTMNDLSVAIPSNTKRPALATKIMGPLSETRSTNIAQRLTQKIGKQVYVSFNVPVSTMTLPAIEKKICEELNAQFALMSS